MSSSESLPNKLVTGCGGLVGAVTAPPSGESIRYEHGMWCETVIVQV